MGQYIIKIDEFSCEGTKESQGVKMRHDMKESSICKHSIRYVNI